jgi:hypothetical protein
MSHPHDRIRSDRQERAAEAVGWMAFTARDADPCKDPHSIVTILYIEQNS